MPQGPWVIQAKQRPAQPQGHPGLGANTLNLGPKVSTSSSQQGLLLCLIASQI